MHRFPFSNSETPAEESRDNNDLNKSTDKEINASDGSKIPANASPIAGTGTGASIIDQSNQERVFNEILTNQDGNAKDEKLGTSSEFNQPTMWLGTEDKT